MCVIRIEFGLNCYYVMICNLEIIKHLCSNVCHWKDNDCKWICLIKDTPTCISLYTSTVTPSPFHLPIFPTSHLLSITPIFLTTFQTTTICFPSLLILGNFLRRLAYNFHFTSWQNIKKTKEDIIMKIFYFK